MMSWSNQTVLWMLASLPVWIGVIVWAARKRLARLRKLGIVKNSQTFRILFGSLIAKKIFLVLAVVLLMIAAAGPRWGWRWVESRQVGLDILIAVDVSRSMEAKDLDPSRIERARRLVMDLLDVAEGDRVGLVAFAGEAFVQCPLTNDFGAVRMFLDVLNTDLIPVQGTDMAEALKIGLKALTTGGEGQGKFMLILSDGEDLGPKLGSALEDIKNAGIKIITIGMAGTEGAPIPETDGSFKKDQSGNLVISKLDESTLKNIAESTGGLYLRASDAGAKMDLIYRGSIRGIGTERETRASKEKVWFERYQWFAGVAVLLLIWEFFISDLKRIIMIGFLLLCLRPFSAQASALDSYNEAVKRFEEGKIDDAIKGFESAAASEDRKIRQRAVYNLGNAKSAKGDLEGAQKAWEEALSLDPQDQQARDNLAWGKKKEKQDQQKKPQDKNKKDDKNQDQNKDQSQSDKQDDSKKDSQDKSDQKPGDQKDKDKKDDKNKAQEQDKQSEQKNEDDKKSESQDKPKDSEEKEQKPTEAKEGKAGEQTDPQKQPDKLSKEEAERLLRMVPDDLGKFYHPPSAPQKSRKIDQDW